MIARITARLTLPPWVAVGPGDDAAVIEPARGALDVVTTDAQVEGIHFDRRFVPAAAIGHRALAVNLSDLAAMGAEPRAALLSLMLPADLAVAELDGVLDGLLSLAAEHRVAVVGGNITRSPGPLIIDVTAIGAVGRRRALTRSGARPGDDVYVTGSLGDGRAGLQMLQAGLAGPPLDVARGKQDPPYESAGRPGLAPHAGRPGLALQDPACKERYLRPEPRVRAGLMLSRNRAASACMDLSDGLADAATQVAAASKVGMLLDASTLPISSGTRCWFEARGENPAGAAVAGGDDYELLFTVRPSQRGRLRGAARMMRGLPITRIGVVTRGDRVTLRTAAGDQPLPQGFEHFR